MPACPTALGDSARAAHAVLLPAAAGRRQDVRADSLNGFLSTEINDGRGDVVWQSRDYFLREPRRRLRGERGEAWRALFPSACSLPSVVLVGDCNYGSP